MSGTLFLLINMGHEEVVLVSIVMVLVDSYFLSTAHNLNELLLPPMKR